MQSLGQQHQRRAPVVCETQNTASGNPTVKITCDGQIESGVVDYIELEHYGVLRVVGWSLKPAEALSVTLSQEGLEQSREPDSRYRTLRHDVVVSGAGHDPLVGFMYEFIGGFGNSEMVVTVDNFSRRIEASEVACLSRVVPHYQTLLSTDRVLHREDIYGSGPPIGNVNPDVLTLAKRLEPPVLDFGCGAGVLVTELRPPGNRSREDRTANWGAWPVLRKPSASATKSRTGSRLIR